MRASTGEGCCWRLTVVVVVGILLGGWFLWLWLGAHCAHTAAVGAGQGVVDARAHTAAAGQGMVWWMCAHTQQQKGRPGQASMVDAHAHAHTTVARAGRGGCECCSGEGMCWWWLLNIWPGGFSRTAEGRGRGAWSYAGASSAHLPCANVANAHSAPAALTLHICCGVPAPAADSPAAST